MKYLVLCLCLLLGFGLLISLLSICGGATDYHIDANGIDGKQYHIIIHSQNNMLRPQLKDGGCIGEYDSDETYMCGVRDFTYYTTKP